MYAHHSHLPRGARAGSLGAALAINAALVAGLIYAAPKVFPPDDIPVLPIRSIPIAPPPEPVETPAPPAAEPQQPIRREIVTPPTIVPTRAESDLTTTTVELPLLPPLPPLPPLPSGASTGTAVEAPRPTPLPLIPAEADPRYARDLQPDYPPAERRAGNDGSVVVRVLIGVDGRVTRVEKVRATGDAFYEATRRQALTRWRFRPATRGDVPQESWKTLTVRFELDR